MSRRIAMKPKKGLVQCRRCYCIDCRVCLDVRPATPRALSAWRRCEYFDPIPTILPSHAGVVVDRPLLLHDGKAWVAIPRRVPVGISKH
jgi:hypothetical protein